MSDIQRRITMLWDSRGASQVRASIGQMSSGLSSYRREMRGFSQDQSMMDKQMRAFGTTLRYALAGGALFGTVNTLRNLGEFQAKLGEISAIGSSPGFDLTGRKLDDLGAKLLKVSTDTATPISEIQEAVANLYSTVQDLTPDQAVTAIETIARTARISQADITDTTQALLGLTNAYNKDMKQIPKFGDEFFQVTRLAAGGPDFAKTYAQQLGVIAQSGKLGHFSPEETMALTIAGSRFGGSAARNLRGQAQLQRQILDPGNKNSEAAYERAGVGRGQRANMGGYEVLMKLLTYANSLPDNQKSTFLHDIFTRSESRNQAVVYSNLLSKGQIAPGSQNMTVAEYLDQVKDSAGEADKAMGRAMDLRRINQAGIAMSNFSLAFASAWNPLIQPAAGAIVGGSSAFQKYSQDHKLEVMGATGAVAVGLLAARKLGSVSRRLPAVGAVSDTLTGGKIRGDSPMNPLYVIVVSQLVGGPKFMPGRNQFPGGQGPAPKPSGGGRFGRFLPFGAGMASGALAVGLGVMATNGGAAHGADRTAFPRMNRLLARVQAGFPIEKLSPAERAAVQSLGNYSISTAPAPRLKAAEAALDGAVAAGVKVSGHATITVHVDQEDAKGNTKRKTTKVPLPLFGDFTSPAPQTAGKSKTKRGK